jgi:hypothetical protein
VTLRFGAQEQDLAALRHVCRVAPLSTVLLGVDQELAASLAQGPRATPSGPPRIPTVEDPHAGSAEFCTQGYRAIGVGEPRELAADGPMEIGPVVRISQESADHGGMVPECEQLDGIRAFESACAESTPRDWGESEQLHCVNNCRNRSTDQCRDVSTGHADIHHQGVGRTLIHDGRRMVWVCRDEQHDRFDLTDVAQKTGQLNDAEVIGDGQPTVAVDHPEGVALGSNVERLQDATSCDALREACGRSAVPSRCQTGP